MDVITMDMDKYAEGCVGTRELWTDGLWVAVMEDEA